MKKFILIPLLMFSISSSWAATDKRWYSSAQVRQGEQVFKQNCASCHGQNAEATPNWKQTDANGNYPPPPLNGTAHAWHHDIELLRRTVREGGQKLGGVMPPFEDKLSSQQIDQAIAYFQSKWPDDLYAKWSGRFEDTSLPSLDDVIVASNNRITRHLRQRIGNVELGDPKQTVLDDIWQVKMQNRFVYLINDGQYALIGDLVDLKSGVNLTEKERRGSALDAINAYGDTELVVYEPKGEIKTTLNVFTDTSCPYCRKLHKEVPRLLDAGIKVRYLPFPRGGKSGPGYQTLRSVWCAKDRSEAMTDAKNQDTSDLPRGDCREAAIVDQGYKTGNQVGVTGTPALFKESGEKIEGYVPYQKLIPMLVKQ